MKVLVIGVGNRGSGYANYALDNADRMQVVGVAEPREFYRNTFKQKYNIPEENCFSDWSEATTKDKFADAALVCTPDRLHVGPALALADKGYHIFLEKPMAVTPEDCEAIVEVCKKNHVILAVGHVLRYTPQAKMIKDIIDSKLIGDVVNIQHTEPIGYWHFAHSYVRGNWRNTEGSTFALLAKSCHDLDLITYWLGDRACVNISSFGSLNHFTKSKKPKGASDRCISCSVESSCPYSAKKIYLDKVKQGYNSFPIDIITEVPDVENVLEALKTGPYGRCVYECDNDVVDNQVVSMQFEGGVTVNFTMVAFTEKVCERQVAVYGTKGELKCNFKEGFLTTYDFLTEQTTKHNVTNSSEAGRSKVRGHGGADFYAMDSFVSAVIANDPSLVLTGPEETLRSHLLCFAAEKARVEGRVVNGRY